MAGVQITYIEDPKTADAKGAGLGLTVAEGIVQQHGGTVSTGIRPGGGARMEVILHAA